MSETAPVKRRVHSGTLHDTALKMALIFASYPEKFDVSPELLRDYRFRNNEGDGTLDVLPLDDCVTDRKGFKKATLYAGVSSDTNYGRSERVEDGEIYRNASQSKYTPAGTQLVFRFECLAPSDARHFMGTLSTYLLASEDSFVADFGGDGGHIRDYSVQRARGPLLITPPDGNGFWRMDIIVEISYHITYRINTVSLPLSHIALRASTSS